MLQKFSATVNLPKCICKWTNEFFPKTFRLFWRLTSIYQLETLYKLNDEISVFRQSVAYNLSFHNHHVLHWKQWVGNGPNEWFYKCPTIFLTFGLRRCRCNRNHNHGFHGTLRAFLESAPGRVVIKSYDRIWISIFSMEFSRFTWQESWPTCPQMSMVWSWLNVVFAFFILL